MSVKIFGPLHLRTHSALGEIFQKYLSGVSIGKNTQEIFSNLEEKLEENITKILKKTLCAEKLEENVMW